MVACEKDINFSVFHYIYKNPSRPAESTSSLKKVSIISTILLLLLASFETQFFVVNALFDIPHPSSEVGHNSRVEFESSMGQFVSNLYVQAIE